MEVEGVMNVIADASDQTVEVTYDDSKTSIEKISAVLSKAKYPPAGTPQILQ